MNYHHHFTELPLAQLFPHHEITSLELFWLAGLGNNLAQRFLGRVNPFHTFFGFRGFHHFCSLILICWWYLSFFGEVHLQVGVSFGRQHELLWGNGILGRRGIELIGAFLFEHCSRFFSFL